MLLGQASPRPAAAAAVLMLLFASTAGVGAAAAAVTQSWQVGAALHAEQQQQQLGNSLIDGSAPWETAAGSGTQPEGVRLSFGDAADEMVVTWNTRLLTAESCVQYRVQAAAAAGVELPGKDSSGGSSAASRRLRAAEAAAASGTAAAAAGGAALAAAGEGLHTACGSRTPFVEPATGQTSQHVHRVTLRSLPPGQAVLYRCGSADGGWSDWRVLRARRSHQQFSPEAPARLLIVGDMGLYNSRCWPDIAAEVATGAPGHWAVQATAQPVAGQPQVAEFARAGPAEGGAGASHDEAAVGGAAAGVAGVMGAGAEGAVGRGRGVSSRAMAAAAAAHGAWPGSAQGFPWGAGYDALLHIGDLAYDLQALDGRRASQFLQMVEPAASVLPYMVAPGNHEWHHNFSHYRALFSMPQRQQASNLFYSFDVGPLHVLVYNTEIFFWPDLFRDAEMRTQYEWMEADLRAANANRQRTPWLLAAGHRPMYCVQEHEGRCNAEHEASRLGLPSHCPHNNPLACRPMHPPGSGPAFPIERLFQRYGVDLAVYGHVHDYERFYPVANYTVPRSPPGSPGSESSARASGIGGGEAAPVPPSPEGLSFDRYVDPRATVHVTSGAGGNTEMRGGDGAPPQGRCEASAPWCAFQSGYAPGPGQSYDYSYSRLAVHNATHLRWQQVSSLLGRVVDEFWVVQSNHGPFQAAT